MDNLQLILAIPMAIGVAGVISTLVQSTLDNIKDINTEEDMESLDKFKRKRAYETLQRESYLEVGDEVFYDNTSAIVLGHGLNNTVSILLEDKVLDVPVNKLKKYYSVSK